MTENPPTTPTSTNAPPRSPCGICGAFIVSATLQSDAIGCYWDITYQHNYCDPNTNQYGFLWNYPYGIQVAVSPSTINSVVFTAAAWNASSKSPITQNPANALPAGTTQVTWSSTPSNTSSNGQFPCASPALTNAIPSNTPVTIKVYVTSAIGPQTLTVTELGYLPPPNENQLCSTTFNAGPGENIYTIKSDSICYGSATLLNLSPATGVDSIDWYSCTPDPGMTCGSVRSSPPAAPWRLVQSGGTVCPTNPLTTTTCYAAVVNTGCFSYVAMATVSVCAPFSDAGVITPSAGLSQISGWPGYRACSSWSGTLSITYHLSSCLTTVVWEVSVDGGPWTPIALPPSAPFATIKTGTLTAPQAPACSTHYSYQVKLTNACGSTVIGPIDIYIDRPLQSSDITLSGALWIPGTSVPIVGPMCNNQSAVISATGTCGKIVQWQESTISATGPWTPISGAGAASAEYFTNNLVNSCWYQVQMQNGACAPVWSASYEVQVKPTLTVSLTANPDCLCPPPAIPPPAILTAAANPPGVTYTYEWFLDWVLMPNKIGDTISVSAPGYYYVEVFDRQCQTTARSNVVTICAPPVVVIAGPCGICPGAPPPPPPVQLTALVSSTPAVCASGCTFSWSDALGNFLGTVDTITVTNPGIYTVTVTCGSCVVKASHQVIQCP